MITLLRNLAALTLAAGLLAGCTGHPDSIRPVEDFDAERYLGQWYEIARLDHSFERGLEQVTATYSRRDDGGIHVVNRGFDPGSGEWKEAEGKAYFVRSPQEGYLKVSFFGPFYGSYVVFDLDRAEYNRAYVAGPNHNYLWFLSRTPDVSDADKSRFVDVAAAAGYDTSQLIFVEHD